VQVESQGSRLDGFSRRRTIDREARRWREMLESDFDRRRSRRAIALLIGAVLLTPLVIGFVLYRMLYRPIGQPSSSAQKADRTRAVAAAPTPKPVPTGVPLQDLPQIDASDAFIRNLAQALSANPEWAKWLVGERLVRRMTASIDNVAEGRSPKPHLAFLAPKGDFRAREQGKSTTIDPASYRRYDLVAEVVASLDAKGCAKLYEDTRPLFQDAYRDLGYPDRNIDQTVAKAIHVLLATPDPSRDVEVREAVKSWKLTDPALESLAPAQKQLLRMGPDNVRKVKEKLREIAEALHLSV
jgi:Protein of unknown function (DUF3014)